MESTPLKKSPVPNGFPNYSLSPHGQDEVGSCKVNGFDQHSDSSKDLENRTEKGDTPDSLEIDTSLEHGGEKKLSFSKLANRSKYVLALCCFAQFCSAVAFAVIAPFYPHEAEKKGLSTTLQGLVFSVFELVNFTVAPLIGNFMTRIGHKFVLVSGIFIAGASSILFGTLDKCPPGTPFFLMSMVCRVFIALGFSAFTVANFSIVSSEFPTNAATVFGVLETMQGIGLMAGPLFGSGLYELGGFCAPFYSLGGLVLVSDVLIYFLLPGAQENEQASTLSMASFVKLPMVLLSLTNITMASIGISFMDSTLARHLEDEFGLSVSLIGPVFVIAPSIYGLLMPLWGFLVDKKNVMALAVVPGLVGTFVGYLFLAPCPWPDVLPSQLWTAIIGLMMLGLSYGPLFIGATKCLVTAALENGYSDNLDTFSLISGLFYFAYCFGSFTGPFIGGFLTQHLGFPVSYTILSLIHVPNIIISITFFIVRRKKRKETK